MLRTSIKEYGEKIAHKAKIEGVQEGIQKGIEEGILEGKKKKAIETARAMLNKKMPVEEISEITGLTVKEIKKL